jgi:polyferredoxin
MSPGLEHWLQTLEHWVAQAASNLKLVEQGLTGMEGSYVEMLTLLAIGLLAALPILAPEGRRQWFRRLSQLLGIAVFLFIVYTCMGVFGMVRNFFRGLSEIGQENILAFYFCSVPVTILATAMIFGPMFCGWMCPTGALQEFAGLLTARWRRRRRAAGWPFSWRAAGLVAGMLALFLLGVLYLSRRRVFFVEDSSIYWAEIMLILQAALLWRMPDWDRRLRRLRVVSFWIIVAAAVAGWWITSPVHLVFTKVYDPASLLSTVIVLLGALIVPQSWCRYLCPWREAIGWAARHSTRRLVLAPERCTQCGRCADVCGVEAVRDGVVDRRECHMCLRCVDHCPSQALALKEEWP